jgi:hypothetical protein
MSKTGYVEIASRLVTVARSCLLSMEFALQPLQFGRLKGRPPVISSACPKSRLRPSVCGEVLLMLILMLITNY